VSNLDLDQHDEQIRSRISNEFMVLSMIEDAKYKRKVKKEFN
jgi:hypothetical protein